MVSNHTWTNPRCSRVAIRTVFIVEKQKIAKSNVGSHFFDSRGSSLDSGDQIFERQHDFLVNVLYNTCFFDCTNRACRSGHGKRNVFWFHEIVEKSKCAQNVRQEHIYTRPASRQLPKSSSGSRKTHDFWKLLLKPSPDNEFSMLSFDGNIGKCASGERLLHICDFHWKALKSNMSSWHSPDPYFRLAHTNATLKMVLWLDSFFKRATPIRCFCTDWLETSRETHENASLFV